MLQSKLQLITSMGSAGSFAVDRALSQLMHVGVPAGQEPENSWAARLCCLVDVQSKHLYPRFLLLMSCCNALQSGRLELFSLEGLTGQAPDTESTGVVDTLELQDDQVCWTWLPSREKHALAANSDAWQCCSLTLLHASQL